MVGTVLLQRMVDQGDLATMETVLFSQTQQGQPCPAWLATAGVDLPPVHDGNDIDQLVEMDVLLSCQGSEYTRTMLPRLRKAGWQGYWLDAAAQLRMSDEAVIALDPVNRAVIDQALATGIKNFCGGNCTVSLMLLATGGLFAHGLVEWISTMTYQAASGAGARAIRELLHGMGTLHAEVADALNDPHSAILAIDRKAGEVLLGNKLDNSVLKAPLVGSLIPYIDAAYGDGRSREEWKGEVETHRILGDSGPVIPIDGLCVRVGSLRSHAQALTIKLTRDLPLDDLAAIIAQANDWVEVVADEPEPSRLHLTPAATSGTLKIPIGRLRKMRMGPEFLSAFTVGDQLLWGAAEPLRRMLGILRDGL